MKNQIKRKRILYHYMLGREAGGSDTCLFLLLKFFNQSKYEPLLLYRDKSRLLEELEAIGIKTIPIPEKIRNQLHKRLKKNAEALKKPATKTGLKKSIINRLGEFWIVSK